MIPADHFHDNQDGTAWLVVPYCDGEDHGIDTHACDIDIKVDDRPCGTCGGTEEDPTTAVGIDPCPANCINGRHTFTLEVEVSGEQHPDHPWDITKRHRVSVVPGMVLPIVGPNFQRTEVGRYIQLKQRKWWLMTRFEKRTAGLTGAGVEITLPPAAKPGMWAVKLAVHS